MREILNIRADLLLEAAVMDYYEYYMSTSNNPVPLEEILQEEEAKPEEIGGVKGPEPTRYGDWQHKGRVSDF